MSYHTINNQLYQAAGCSEHVREALKVLAGCKLNKKQRQALEIATANAAYSEKLITEARGICSEKLTQALDTMQASSSIQANAGDE